MYGARHDDHLHLRVWMRREAQEMNQHFLALGRLPAGVMNKTEGQHADTLQLRLLAKEVLWYGFEVVKFYIGATPDGRQMWYSPDFLVQLADSTMEIHEVKGAYITEDSAAKLVAAARLYPQFLFVRYQKTKRGWERKEIRS